MSGAGGGGIGTKMINFLVFVFGLTLFADLGECITVNLTDAQIQMVLDAHNQYRKQEGAANMNYMVSSNFHSFFFFYNFIDFKGIYFILYLMDRNRLNVDFFFFKTQKW